MKTPLRLLFLLLLLLSATTGPAQTPPAVVKPGYTVVTEISFNEEGVPVEASIVRSDDPTGDHALEQMAINFSRQDKQAPRIKEGKAVKFKARRPFNFPVEDDEGEAANDHRPVLRAGDQKIPVYPESLAAKDEIGGAIIELLIKTDGTVKSVRTLRASHPEFAQAAEEALAQWTFLPDERPGAPAERRWRAAIGFTTNGRPLELKWRLAPRPAIGGFIVGRNPPATTNADVAPLAPPTPEQPAAAPAEKK
ncbi:MAG TPA: TonB family protein [Lacunisphaera sp.]|nr:TonB family protein [Lacunisphaera sp.]